LARALDDPDEMLRRRAAVALGSLGAEARQAAPALVKALADPSPAVRRWAAAAVGELGPIAPQAIPALIGGLADDDARHRALSAAARVRMGGRAVPRLVEALCHPDPTLRCHAPRILGRTGRPEAVAALAGLVDDPDPEVRAEVAAALAEETAGRR